MALRLFIAGTLRSRMPFKPKGSVGSHDTSRSVIGNREIVGYGKNGNPEYADEFAFPMPSLRWKETTPDFCALQEKEKGDWRKLTLEEKKCIYRSNFRQTFAEMNQPTGHWKFMIGGACMLSGLAMLLYAALFTYVYPPLPSSFSEESRRAQLRRLLDIRNGAVTGIASKWDYKTDTWK